MTPNLRVLLTGFVGRRRELADVRRFLEETELCASLARPALERRGLGSRSREPGQRVPVLGPLSPDRSGPRRRCRGLGSRVGGGEGARSYDSRSPAGAGVGGAAAGQLRAPRWRTGTWRGRSGSRLVRSSGCWRRVANPSESRARRCIGLALSESDAMRLRRTSSASRRFVPARRPARSDGGSDLPASRPTAAAHRDGGRLRRRPCAGRPPSTPRPASGRSRIGGPRWRGTARYEPQSSGARGS